MQTPTAQDRHVEHGTFQQYSQAPTRHLNIAFSHRQWFRIQKMIASRASTLPCDFTFCFAIQPTSRQEVSFNFPIHFLYTCESSRIRIRKQQNPKQQMRSKTQVYLVLDVKPFQHAVFLWHQRDCTRKRHRTCDSEC